MSSRWWCQSPLSLPGPKEGALNDCHLFLIERAWGASNRNAFPTHFEVSYMCSMCKRVVGVSSTSEKELNAAVDRKAFENDSLHFRYQHHVFPEEHVYLLRCNVFRSCQTAVIPMVNKSHRDIRRVISLGRPWLEMFRITKLTACCIHFSAGSHYALIIGCQKIEKAAEKCYIFETTSNAVTPPCTERVVKIRGSYMIHVTCFAMSFSLTGLSGIHIFSAMMQIINIVNGDCLRHNPTPVEPW
jgi:hypothetical protein